MVAIFLGTASAHGASADPCSTRKRTACFRAAEQLAADGNFDLAIVSFKKACFQKHEGACRRLAEIALKQGLIGLAREGFEESCRFGDTNACRRLKRPDLGGSSEKLVNDSGPLDQATVDLWTVACNKGSASGCRKLGEAERLLGRNDAARASWLKGCSLGDRTSCEMVLPASSSSPAIAH